MSSFCNLTSEITKHRGIWIIKDPVHLIFSHVKLARLTIVEDRIEVYTDVQKTTLQAMYYFSEFGTRWFLTRDGIYKFCNLMNCTR